MNRVHITPSSYRIIILHTTMQTPKFMLDVLAYNAFVIWMAPKAGWHHVKHGNIGLQLCPGSSLMGPKSKYNTRDEESQINRKRVEPAIHAGHNAQFRQFI